MPEFHELLAGEEFSFDQWTERDKIAYAAGVIDGEGCITVQRNTHRGFRLYVQVSQHIKGWPLLDFLKDHMSAKCDNFYRPPGNRALKRTAFWGGQPAYLFLKKIRPFLLIKSKQADLGVEFQEQINSVSVPHWNWGHMVDWNTEMIQFAESIRSRIQSLNSRGRNQQMFF